MNKKASVKNFDILPKNKFVREYIFRRGRIGAFVSEERIPREAEQNDIIS